MRVEQVCSKLRDARRWALAAFVVLLMVPGVARASSTLDQSQTDTSDGQASILGPDNINEPASEAQTFTAGLTGGLDRADLYLFKSSGSTPTAPLTVQIRNSSGGAPGSTVLASASVPASGVPTYPSSGWVEVDFPSPAPVTSGTQYAIVAYTGDTGADTAYAWGFSRSNPYSGGALWFSEGSPPTTFWIESSTVDLAFKTYVEPNATDQAAQLVTDSTGLGPGTSLADKASEIQSAVNSGQTATACRDIADYLGLVKAQTAKKLTTTQAAQLRIDADNLAAALGCS